MTDYVTAEEAKARLVPHEPPHVERLLRTVIHQAELLADARKALQRIAQYDRNARAAIARLDSQEERE